MNNFKLCAVKENHNITFIFLLLLKITIKITIKSWVYYLIMQELGKLYFKINVILYGLGKYMSLNINKLIFIECMKLVLHELV